MTPRKKKTQISEPAETLDVQFCTECREQLDEFDMSDKANSPAEIKKNYENCLKAGKFKGEMCSKIFIASIDDSVWNEE